MILNSTQRGVCLEREKNGIVVGICGISREVRKSPCGPVVVMSNELELQWQALALRPTLFSANISIPLQNLLLVWPLQDRDSNLLDVQPSSNHTSPNYVPRLGVGKPTACLSKSPKKSSPSHGVPQALHFLMLYIPSGRS